VKISPDSVEDQISSCLKAVDGLNRAIRGRDRSRLAKANRKLNQEMELLQQHVEGVSLDEQQIDQLRQLNIQFRRSQRQLSSQMAAVESDVVSLEKGMRKVAMIKEALEES